MVSAHTFLLLNPTIFIISATPSVNRWRCCSLFSVIYYLLNVVYTTSTGMVLLRPPCSFTWLILV